jgi:chemotaxis protein CheD
MSRRDVQFGLGDLAATMAELVGSDGGAAGGGDGPPAVGSGETAYVHVGQLYASAERRLVSTILGSCVSVCLWDPELGIGGLNHFLLPQCVQNGGSSSRFGNVAIAELFEQLQQLGAVRHRLKAKMFGGASVIDAFQSANASLGMQNVALARRLLADARIPIVNEDVGGTQGRKLVFQTHDGAAWVRHI